MNKCVILNKDQVIRYFNPDSGASMTEPFFPTDILGGVRNDKGDKLEIETKADCIFLRIVQGEGKTAEFEIKYPARELMAKTINDEIVKCVKHVSSVRARTTKA